MSHLLEFLSLFGFKEDLVQALNLVPSQKLVPLESKKEKLNSFTLHGTSLVIFFLSINLLMLASPTIKGTDKEKNKFQVHIKLLIIY